MKKQKNLIVLTFLKQYYILTIIFHIWHSKMKHYISLLLFYCMQSVNRKKLRGISCN